MKYVALLSGGKDSCYNLLHCKKNGHELVAAASLGPKPGSEEIDSYMYQTVGQDAIELVARALDVPLYRHVIAGQAIHQELSYGERLTKDGVQGDETEDLYQLLATVKVAQSQHPDVQGVSVGAILSSYQRTRVEHVCNRLSLTSLAYLWQRDQSELLSEMISAGLTAVLIKVAGIGLTTRHLGKTLAEMQVILEKLNKQYGSHVCGEGGEYETLTVDCPMFKQKIVLENVETVIHSESDFAPVAYLRVKEARLENKDIDKDNLIEPPLLDDEFASLQAMILQAQESQLDLEYCLTGDFEEGVPLPITTSSSDCWVSICNIQATPGHTDLTLEAEVEQCFRIMKEHLASHSLDLSHVTNILIFLSSIDDFAHLNQVYARHFGTNPPSRACVAIDLPTPTRVRLECVANSSNPVLQRQALHVQGLSYWAPANIGPYSQAIIVNEHIYISGQIGLIPASLSLPSPPSLATETALSFQHLQRIIDVLSSNAGKTWPGFIQTAIYWLDAPHNTALVRAGERAYEEKLNHPALFLCIKALPKGALVEKQVLAHTGRCFVKDEDDEVVAQICDPVYEKGTLCGDSGAVSAHYEVSLFKDSGDFSCIIFVENQSLDQDMSNLKQWKNITQYHALLPYRSTTTSLRAFWAPHNRSRCLALCSALFDKGIPITEVPCRHIASRDHDNLGFALWLVGKR